MYFWPQIYTIIRRQRQLVYLIKLKKIKLASTIGMHNFDSGTINGALKKTSNLSLKQVGKSTNNAGHNAKSPFCRLLLPVAFSSTLCFSQKTHTN